MVQLQSKQSKTKHKLGENKQAINKQHQLLTAYKHILASKWRHMASNDVHAKPYWNQFTESH